MVDDPWKDLATPLSIDKLNARRVDATLPWNFFWAKGVDRQCLLILRHMATSTPKSKIPRLKDIEIRVTSEADGTRIVAFTLLDSAHRDVFYRLCRDIVAAASEARTEKEAVEVFIARTWRWHHLLRGGDDRLSPEEQKGVIGELLVLERVFLHCLSPAEAISLWRGPLGAPKDFCIGRVCVEVKARREDAKPFVVISNEHQLDESGVDKLFLYVVALDQGSSVTAGSFTLPEVVDRVRNKISGIDPSSVGAYEGLLEATGFRREDDYSDFRWVEGKDILYHVKAGFPCITPIGMATGISDVKYSLSLVVCSPFLVSERALLDALKTGAM